jgi:hypothetical protein
MDETARHRGTGTIVTGGFLAEGAVDGTSPYTAQVGQYAHRLAIAGHIHPAHGEQRTTLQGVWQWDADRHGWERVA